VRIGVNGRFLAAVPTGVQRFALEITRRLLPRIDGVLLLPRGVTAPPELAARAEVRQGRLAGHLWEQLELPEMARRAGADVTLHLANALPTSGGPHAVVLHDAIVFDHPEWYGARYGFWHRRVLLPAARRAAAVGTLSADAARALARVLGRSADDIVVIPQGASPLDEAASGSAVRAVRRQFGLARPYLLAVGAGDPRKNVDFLAAVMDAWASREGTSPPTLVIVGGGAERVFASAAASAEGAPVEAGALQESAGPPTLRLGHVDDETLRALYTGAAAFCFPSLAEGFGRPPLEALACGTPVVAAPYGPAREVLRDAAEILPLDVGRWLAALERLTREGPPRGFSERAEAVVRAHRWEDGAGAALAMCARAASADRRKNESFGPRVPSSTPVAQRSTSSEAG
jgi:glycosyltransferase involved in cell wall biosynthesis